ALMANPRESDDQQDLLGRLIAASPADRFVMIARLKSEHPELAVECERALLMHEAADRAGFMSTPVIRLEHAPPLQAETASRRDSSGHATITPDPARVKEAFDAALDVSPSER